MSKQEEEKKDRKRLTIRVDAYIEVDLPKPIKELITGEKALSVIEKQYPCGRAIRASTKAPYVAIAYAYCERLRKNEGVLKSCVNLARAQKMPGQFCAFDEKDPEVFKSLISDLEVLASKGPTQRLLTMLCDNICEVSGPEEARQFPSAGSVDRIAKCLQVGIEVVPASDAAFGVDGTVRVESKGLIFNPVSIYVSNSDKECVVAYRTGELKDCFLVFNSIADGWRKLFFQTFYKVLPTAPELGALLTHPASLDREIKEALPESARKDFERKASRLYNDLDSLQALLKTEETRKLLNNVRAAVSASAAAVPPPGERTVKLGCGHEVPVEDLQKHCAWKKALVKEGPFVVQCPLCDLAKRFYFLTVRELARVFMGKRKEYQELFAGADIRVEQCMICGKAGTTVSFLHRNHTICRECLQRYMRQEELSRLPRPSFEGSAECPVPGCQFKFVYNCVVNVEMRKTEYRLPHAFVYEPDPRAKKPARAAIHLLVCNRCGLHVSKDQGAVTSCSHCICRPCILRTLDNYYKNGAATILDIKCPTNGCTALLTLSFFKKLALSGDAQRQFAALVQRGELVCPLRELVLCPKCGARAKIGNVGGWNEKCPKCQAQFCRRCGNSHDGSKCSRASRKEYRNKLTKMHAEYFAGYKQNTSEELSFSLLPCPHCLTFSLCIEGAEKSRCYNPRCGQEFCTVCFCKLGPVRAHGALYHRPKCVYRKETDGRLIYSQDCPECLATGRLCVQPGEPLEGFEVPEAEQVRDAAKK